jgi:enoyl-CoA hydratase/carnithine racemase
MQWTPDTSAGPRGYLSEPDEFKMLDITMPIEGVAMISMNRPEKLNAFNTAMIGELRAAMWRMNYDDRVRVIVLTGKGRGFCAGRDVEELRGERGMPLPHYMVGIENVKDMVMTGRTVDAHEMRDMRFVRRVVPHDSLLDEVLAYARLLMKGAPLAIGIGKSITNTCQNIDTDSGRMLERLAQSSLVGSIDSTEGVKAFLEKRKPNFTGR